MMQELELTEKDHIKNLARRIFDHGFSIPAILFLEMMKYVSFLGSQTMVFFGPFLTVFIKSDPYYKMAELMEDKNNVEFLMLEIEKLESEKKAQNG
ncbi:MAG: hypothetical protein H8E60_09840 [Candidatus Marinimicrobia bacterium]|nr:hypothetical protein [Candidatus Neomarinimicrobiota bacterium]